MKKLYRSIIVLVAVLLAAGLVAVEAYATGSVELETATVQQPKERIWTVGLGVAAVPDYEGSEDYKAAPVPVLKVVDPSGWFVDLVGNTLRANVVPSRMWRLGPMLRYRPERDNVDNDKVDKMEKVDAALEAGGFAGIDIDNWNFKVEVTSDVTDANNGTLVGISGGYTWPMRSWRLTVNGFTTYANGNYMSTYFGVDSEDAARSGLKRYEADAGFKDVGAMVVSSYRFTEHWGVIGAVRYAKLLGDAADSPVVDDEGNDNQYLVGAAVSYTF